MNTDEATKAAFCRRVANKPKFWTEFGKIARRQFPDAEAKFKVLGKFLAKQGKACQIELKEFQEELA